MTAPKPNDRGQHLTSTRRVVESDWLTLQHDKVVDDSGQRSEYWIVRRPPFVLVVLRRRDSDGDALGLVERFRYPVGLWFWEFPQRRIVGSSPADVEATAAQVVRDLSVGELPTSDLTHLGRFFEAYGYSDHQCHCYVADIAGDIDRAFPTVKWLNRESIVHQSDDVQIADAATLAALTLLEAARQT